MGKKIFPLYPTTQEFFFHCILHHNRILCGVLYPTIQHRRILGSNTEKSSTVYPITPQVFFRCIPQWKIFSSVMGYDGRGFFLQWDTAEEVFLHCGIQLKRFFPLWDTMEEVFFHCGIQWRKMIQCRMIFLKFKCLSLPSNINLGKISYLNSQTNPRKKLKMENYLVNPEKNFFPLWDTLQQRLFYF